MEFGAEVARSVSSGRRGIDVEEKRGEERREGKGREERRGVGSKKTKKKKKTC